MHYTRAEEQPQKGEKEFKFFEDRQARGVEKKKEQEQQPAAPGEKKFAFFEDKNPKRSRDFEF